MSIMGPEDNKKWRRHKVEKESSIIDKHYTGILSGKTIIPFNVHNGSRFSSTISTIRELEPDASIVEDGFTVSERSVADAEEDVQAWLSGLGY